MLINKFELLLGAGSEISGADCSEITCIITLFAQPQLTLTQSRSKFDDQRYWRMILTQQIKVVRAAEYSRFKIQD